MIMRASKPKSKQRNDKQIHDEECVSPDIFNNCFNPGYIFRKYTLDHVSIYERKFFHKKKYFSD